MGRTLYLAALSEIGFIIPNLSVTYQHTIDRLHPTERRWFVLRTAHRHEKKAALHLQKRGVDYFLPLQQTEKHYERKTVVRQTCLLPGYLFVYITKSEALAIYENPYVQFLKIGTERLDVPATEIEILRRIVGEKDLQLQWELQPFTKWQVGQQVELIGGQLTGLRGTFLENHNKGCLLISLGLLPAGMGLQTVIPASQVRPINVGQPA